MELIKVGEKTYYIKNATNIGVYKIDEENVYLIDTGNDKDAGKKILKIIIEQGWNVKGIINTHSNADHIGGNKVIQDRTNCRIFAHNIEKAISWGAGRLLEKIQLFDIYQGAQIPEGKKSVAYSVWLRSQDSTLTDKEIDDVNTKIIKKLESIGAEIRK